MQLLLHKHGFPSMLPDAQQRHGLLCICDGYGVLDLKGLQRQSAHEAEVWVRDNRASIIWQTSDCVQAKPLLERKLPCSGQVLSPEDIKTILVLMRECRCQVVLVAPAPETQRIVKKRSNAKEDKKEDQDPDRQKKPRRQVKDSIGDIIASDSAATSSTDGPSSAGTAHAEDKARVLKRPAAYKAGSGRPSGESSSPYTEIFKWPDTQKEIQTQLHFEASIKEWASKSIPQRHVATNLQPVQLKGHYKYIGFCTSCKTCNAKGRGWGFVAQFDLNSRRTIIRAKPTKAHGKFDLEKGQNKLTSSARSAALTFLKSHPKARGSTAGAAVKKLQPRPVKESKYAMLLKNARTWFY